MFSDTNLSIDINVRSLATAIQISNESVLYSIIIEDSLSTMSAANNISIGRLTNIYCTIRAVKI